MIKKKLMLLVFLTLSLASCGTPTDTSSSSYSEPVISSSSSEEKNDFDTLNELLKKDYSQIKYEITTSKDDLSLKSIYEIKKENDGYHVSYNKEKYGTFDVDNSSIPSEMKSNETGSYITQENECSLAKFVLNSSLFSSYTISKNSFNASLNNGKQYLKTNYNCNNFAITIKFGDSIISIEINYTLDDGTKCNLIFSDIR